MTKNYTRDRVLGAIRESGGITKIVATRLACSWATARKYINKWSSTRDAFEAESEEILDVAESVLQRNIQLAYKQQGETQRPVDSSDAKWLLSRKGKGRGYADKSEVELGGKGGGAIAVANVELTDAERRAVIAGMLGLSDETD